ncbi:MAG: pseudouridine synthase [Anaeroplasma sp.]
MIRLDKMLSHCGYGSRKEVKQFIRKGIVLVNGEIILDDDFKVDEEKDDVIIADNTVTYEKLIYIMLNKPAGYVSATYDLYDPTVIDLIKGYEKRNLFPVGRLDKDTVGLQIITNDGKMAHELLSPKNHIKKEYFVQFEGDLPNDYNELLANGIIIDEGYKCLPANFILKSKNEGIMTIEEGKYHQVKRMMEALNCKVIYLKRIKFGKIELDEALKEGEYRFLSSEELNLLKK